MSNYGYSGYGVPHSHYDLATDKPPVDINGLEVAEVRATDAETGAQKGRKPEEYALIPVGALADIARVYGYGARKYSPNNWRKGYPWSWSYSALQRHLNAFWDGEDLDPESGLPHLAHAGFHVLTLRTYSSGAQYVDKDDRFDE